MTFSCKLAKTLITMIFTGELYMFQGPVGPSQAWWDEAHLNYTSYLWCEALEFTDPIGQSREGGHNQEGAHYFLFYHHGNVSNALDGLSQSHLISQDPIDAILPQHLTAKRKWQAAALHWRTPGSHWLECVTTSFNVGMMYGLVKNIQILKYPYELFILPKPAC